MILEYTVSLLDFILSFKYVWFSSFRDIFVLLSRTFNVAFAYIYKNNDEQRLYKLKLSYLLFVKISLNKLRLIH